MLRRIEISGFRSFGYDRVTIPLAPITVIVGRNGSGKSSLLKALLAIKQTIEATQIPGAFLANGPLVELGRFADYVHKHNRRGRVQFGIAFAPRRGLLSRDETGRFSIGPQAICEAEVTLRLAGNRTVADSFGIQTHDLAIRAQRGARGTYSFSLRSGDSAHIATIPRTWVQGKFHHLASPPTVVTKELEWKRYTSSAPRQLAALFEDEFRRMAYLGPLREHPHRMYYFPESVSQIGLKGENAVGMLAAGESRLRRRMDDWLIRFGLSLQWTLRRQAGSYYQLHLTDPHNKTSVNLADSAFGASQILPIIVAGFTLPSFGSLVLEQPEIHLHPGAQATLGDLFIAVTSGPARRSVIVETHSEHIVARLQRRVAEGSIPPDMVQVLYFEPDVDGTKVTPLALGGSGQFSDWPRGLFEESWAETVALVEAAFRTPPEEV